MMSGVHLNNITQIFSSTAQQTYSGLHYKRHFVTSAQSENCKITYKLQV